MISACRRLDLVFNVPLHPCIDRYFFGRTLKEEWKEEWKPNPETLGNGKAIDEESSHDNVVVYVGKRP